MTIVVVSAGPSTTALDIIKRALRLLGVYAKGEEPSPEESADGLAALNALMGSLSNTPLVYAKTLDAISLEAGVTSITVGPTGSTVTERPMRVLEDSYIQSGSVSYPLDVFTAQQYGDVAVKGEQGIPVAVWPLMGMPDVTLTFWPVPTSGLDLYLWSTKALATFPALTTEVSLPEGYEDLLSHELGDALGPEYQTALPAAAARRLARLRRNLKRTNLQVPQIESDDCARPDVLKPL